MAAAGDVRGNAEWVERAPEGSRCDERRRDGDVTTVSSHMVEANNW